MFAGLALPASSHGSEWILSGQIVACSTHPLPAELRCAGIRPEHTRRTPQPTSEAHLMPAPRESSATPLVPALPQSTPQEGLQDPMEAPTPGLPWAWLMIINGKEAPM